MAIGERGVGVGAVGQVLSQRSRTTISFRNVHPCNRWRHVAPGAQSVPELVEVSGEPLLELPDGLSIYASRSLIPFVEVEIADDDGGSLLIALRDEIVEVFVAAGCRSGLRPKSSMISKGMRASVANLRS